jgi:hypothetical protein
MRDYIVASKGSVRTASLGALPKEPKKGAISCHIFRVKVLP